MNNKLIISFILSLLFVPLVLGVVANNAASVASPTDAAIICSDLKNSFFSENIKTRADLRMYFDTKSKELTETISADNKAVNDENYRIFEERMNNLANKMLIKACIGLICSLLFALALRSLIRRAVRKVNEHKGQVITDGLQR